MPGYGLLGPDEGGGLLSWSWAEARLVESRSFWLATVWPDGRPHLMPVWAIWHEAALWLSSSRGSRKARNLAQDSRCTVSTDDPANPVVVEGTAQAVTDNSELELMLRLENEKYGTDYGMETLDPALNTAFRIRPTWVFALRTDNFTGSPTRWTF